MVENENTDTGREREYRQRRSEVKVEKENDRESRRQRTARVEISLRIADDPMVAPPPTADDALCRDQYGVLFTYTFHVTRSHRHQLLKVMRLWT
jgi:hypothetical protein